MRVNNVKLQARMGKLVEVPGIGRSEYLFVKHLNVPNTVLGNILIYASNKPRERLLH